MVEVISDGFEFIQGETKSRNIGAYWNGRRVNQNAWYQGRGMMDDGWDRKDVFLVTEIGVGSIGPIHRGLNKFHNHLGTPLKDMFSVSIFAHFFKIYDRFVMCCPWHIWNKSNVVRWGRGLWWTTSGGGIGTAEGHDGKLITNHWCQTRSPHFYGGFTKVIGGWFLMI